MSGVATFAFNSDPTAGNALPGGRLREVFGTITGDTAYPSGGYAVTAANVGLTELVFLDVSSVDSTGTYLATVTSAFKVKMWSSLGTENSTADVHTSVFNFRAVGY